MRASPSSWGAGAMAAESLAQAEPISLDDIRAARDRIAASVLRTPLVRLHVAPFQV